MLAVGLSPLMLNKQFNFDDLEHALDLALRYEEAHRYVSQRPTGYAIDASRTFKRIAKES